MILNGKHSYHLLDVESEHLVQEALKSLMKGRTVIMVAHRLSTIRSADRVAFVDNGRVIESGTYEELLRLPNGAFKSLANHDLTLQPSSPAVASEEEL